MRKRKPRCLKSSRGSAPGSPRGTPTVSSSSSHRSADVVMVTSEESLLRGPDEIRAFLQRYVRGTTTYSWTWDRRDVSAAGAVGWLLAEGTETAAAQGREEKHPYRMSLVCEKRDGRWLLLQIHGSSPHHG
jgi:ketosteroid isomerase-like protein